MLNLQSLYLLLEDIKKLNIPTRIRKYDIDSDYFDVINSDIKAYLLGYLFADGTTIFSNSRRIYGFKLKLHKKDEHILRLFKSELRSDCPIVDDSGTNCSYIQISSKKIATDLIKHGCVTGKSLILKYPNIEKKYYNPFIHGYFDGDGNIYYGESNNRKQRHFKLLGTYDFLNSVKDYFESKSIDCYEVSKYDNSNIYQLRCSKIESLRKIYHLFYNDITYDFLNRKKIIFGKLTFIHVHSFNLVQFIFCII